MRGIFRRLANTTRMLQGFIENRKTLLPMPTPSAILRDICQQRKTTQEKRSRSTKKRWSFTAATSTRSSSTLRTQSGPMRSFSKARAIWILQQSFGARPRLSMVHFA